MKRYAKAAQDALSETSHAKGGFVTRFAETARKLGISGVNYSSGGRVILKFPEEVHAVSREIEALRDKYAASRFRTVAHFTQDQVAEAFISIKKNVPGSYNRINLLMSLLVEWTRREISQDFDLDSEAIFSKRAPRHERHKNFTIR